MPYSPTPHLKPSREDWSRWFGSFNPYASSTFQFNERHSNFGGGDASTINTIARVRSRLFEVSQRLDQFYFNSKNVTERIAKRDRFDAICIIEKVDVSPHVHLAWFHRGERERNVSNDDPRSVEKSPAEDFFDSLSADILFPNDKQNRLCVLLQCLNKSHLEVTPEDREFLPSFRNDPFRCKHQDPIPKDALFNWQHRGWSVHTESTYSPGWDRYISKELGTAERSDRVFFLSDAFGDRQRTQPTRYHTIDFKTGAMHLDLDAPLKARR
ncbi:MAG TPA: hypothetical protein PK417_03160 [Hyphomonas sp.]|nr:hypothetical protein [Hyphomonas sp.]